MSDRLGYPLIPLHQVARRITDGSHFSPTPREHGHLIANVKDMRAGTIDFSTCTRISASAYRELKATGCTIKNGNVLLSKDGTVGRVVVYRQDDEIGALSSICIIEPSDRLDAAFLGQALQSEGCTRQYDNFMSGSALKRLVLRDIRSIQVPLPRSGHQRAIAQVLDTLDTAIYETEAIITKLKAVKQGLLHDLLTRGIDANGELRPPQTEVPHLYKPSPLGWIPKEWNVHVFGDTIEHVIDFRGRTPKKLGLDWGGGGILALSANNVQPGGIDISREAYFGSERLYRKWMTNGDLRKGDVLLTMEAPLGNVAQIPDDSKYILSQRVIALRFKTDAVLNDFAFWQMQSNEFQQAMVRRSTGSTATGIQRAQLVKLNFKAPLPGEQALIAQRLFSVEQRLATELVALEKQRQEKSGLMDDLLTGRVRVTPLLTPAVQHEMEESA